MFTTLFSKDPVQAEPERKEGDLYKVVNTFGRTFELKYGYYGDCDRRFEPDVIYPDFTKDPVYTDEGTPFVTKTEVNTLRQDLNDQYGKLLELINANTLDIGTINTTLGEINTTLATLATKTDVESEISRLGNLITALTTRVSTNETAISANAGEISSLKTTVENLATELRGADEVLTNSVNDLTLALTTLTGRVDTVEQDIAKLKQDLADAINKLYNDIADGDKLNTTPMRVH